MANQPNSVPLSDEDPTQDQKPSRARINGRRAAAILLVGSALVPSTFSPGRWLVNGAEKLAGAAAGKVDQGFAEESQPPKGVVVHNPAIIEGPIGGPGNNNLQTQPANTTEAQPDVPALPSVDQLPDSQKPNANNGPGLNTT